MIACADEQFWKTIEQDTEGALSDHAVTRGLDTPSALAAVHRQVPDLVIVDMGLPDNGVFNLLATLSQKFDDVPVIAMSTVASLLVIIRLRNAGSLQPGSLRVARKPVDLSALAAPSVAHCSLSLHPIPSSWV